MWMVEEAHKISNSKRTHVDIAKKSHSYSVKAVKGTELNQEKTKILFYHL